jgi:hypothetical protein
MFVTEKSDRHPRRIAIDPVTPERPASNLIALASVHFPASRSLAAGMNREQMSQRGR